MYGSALHTANHLQDPKKGANQIENGVSQGEKSRSDTKRIGTEIPGKQQTGPTLLQGTHYL
jgi:hypothetical protein